MSISGIYPNHKPSNYQPSSQGTPDYLKEMDHDELVVQVLLHENELDKTLDELKTTKNRMKKINTELLDAQKETRALKKEHDNLKSSMDKMKLAVKERDEWYKVVQDIRNDVRLNYPTQLERIDFIINIHTGKKSSHWRH